MAEDVQMLAESTAFQSQEDSLEDLQKQYDLVKAQKHQEKAQKEQEAISYMEKYKVRQATIGKSVTDLAAKVNEGASAMVIAEPAKYQSSELNLKHDIRTKDSMQNVLRAMAKVTEISEEQPTVDPVVASAQKAAADAAGGAIYTVLGLSGVQLTKDYLLDMDAAVAAYDAAPTKATEEKLHKALAVSQEKLGKEGVREEKIKSEKSYKHHRTKVNARYAEAEWKDYRDEVAIKTQARNSFVAELNAKEAAKNFANGNVDDEKAAKQTVLRMAQATATQNEEAQKADAVKAKADEEAAANRETRSKSLETERALKAKNQKQTSCDAAKVLATNAKEVEVRAKAKVETSTIATEKTKDLVTQAKEMSEKAVASKEESRMADAAAKVEQRTEEDLTANSRLKQAKTDVATSATDIEAANTEVAAKCG